MSLDLFIETYTSVEILAVNYLYLFNITINFIILKL